MYKKFSNKTVENECHYKLMKLKMLIDVNNNVMTNSLNLCNCQKF